MAEKNKLSRFAVVLIVVSLAGVLCVPCTGVVAAVAIPSFVGYVRRSKTVEATSNIAALRIGITEYTMREGGPALIESLPATPAVNEVGSMKRVWPSDAGAGWASIGFQPVEPLYYSYSVTTDPLSNTVVIEAVGDLDDDGVRSSFAQHGHMDASGDITWDDIVITNELE